MKDKIISIIEKAMIIIFLCVIIFYQNNHILWLDELDWGIGIIIDNPSLKSIVNTVLATGENLPLFYIFLFIAKNIFGYNQWLLTLFSSTIFTIIGVIGIIKVSDKILGRKNRIFTIFYIFISYTIIAMCGWQLRPYGILFCFSSWLLYFYLNKLEDNSNSNLVKFTIIMILIMYSHWYGVLISLIYAFIDLILFFKKKNKWKFIIPYIIAGLAFLPSFIILLWYHKSDINTYGVEVPNIFNIWDIFRFLSTDPSFETIILIFSINVIIFISKNNKLKIISIIPLMLILSTYIYSKYINPQGAIIRNRYFSVVLPHAIILLSYFLIKTVNYISSKENIKKVFIPFMIIYIIYEICISYIYIFTIPNHQGESLYQGWVEYLENREDIYDDNTLIICTYGKTWIDYYFKCKGKKLPKNIISIDPLDQPNSYHMEEEDIKNFNYFVKNGKYVKDKVTKEEIEKYDTIYYMEEYRTINKEFIDIFDSYDEEIIYSSKLLKLEKIN